MFYMKNSHSRMVRKWGSMIARCYRQSHPAWRYYGGRGVTVCDRWRQSQATFEEDMGQAPEGYWLDRIDNNKGYEPGNCRWVTPKESAANRRPTGSPPDPNSLRQKAKAAGLSYMLVYHRVAGGWPLALALSTPPLKRGRITDAKRSELGLLGWELMDKSHERDSP